MMKIIVNCGPCEEYIGKSLASIKAQTYSDWEAYVTVDPCEDRTLERAIEVQGDDKRIAVTRNDRRLYSLANLVNAVERSSAQPEDVIVNLDGDDWFYDENALQIIADTYARNDCWMTYGSWISHVAYKPGTFPAYPEGTTDFRGTEWLATAVRTFKKWLWDLIDLQDLKDEQGEYFQVAEDVAVMFPMLEMSGTSKAKKVQDILMLYNRTDPADMDELKRSNIECVCRYLRAKPRYQRLQGKIIIKPSSRSATPLELFNPSIHRQT